MRISELAEQAGVSVSTVRYYERIGLVQPPQRTPSGYRAYDVVAAARLRFVTRAKRIGLSLDQISELLSAWDGVHCATTHDVIKRFVDSKKADVLATIRELEQFVEQLDEVKAALGSTPPPAECLPDLSCCLPGGPRTAVTEFLGMPARRGRARGSDCAECERTNRWESSARTTLPT